MLENAQFSWQVRPAVPAPSAFAVVIPARPWTKARPWATTPFSRPRAGELIPTYPSLVGTSIREKPRIFRRFQGTYPRSQGSGGGAHCRYRDVPRGRVPGVLL